MTVEQIAAVCHEANKTLCEALGDTSQLPWTGAPEWQRVSAIAGVKFHLANPDAKPSQSHESWFAHKVAEGWTYGPAKDPDAKEHPCMVPFDRLPLEQQAKDVLFKHIVDALRALVPMGGVPA